MRVAPVGRASPDLPRAKRWSTPGLRILLAHDLSPQSARAATLVIGAAWPGSTVVRVVSSPIGIGSPVSSFATPHEAWTHGRATREMIESAQERIVDDLRDAGLTAERATLPGRPERTIVADAEWIDADLIVVGARDLGPLAAVVLGSVSRLVAETSRCSVLVARGPTVRRVILVADDSPPGRLATSIVATWPMFADARIRVVGVREAPGRALAVGGAKHAAGHRDVIEGSTPTMLDIVDLTVVALARQGRDVESEILVGYTGTEIVKAARRWSADLIVIGAEAESPLRRLLLGGVVRNVLDGVGSSVLVARHRPRRTTTIP